MVPSSLAGSTEEAPGGLQVREGFLEKGASQQWPGGEKKNKVEGKESEEEKEGPTLRLKRR